ncbi:hypothetical protein D3C77_560220 [compost metagenome]
MLWLAWQVKPRCLQDLRVRLLPGGYASRKCAQMLSALASSSPPAGLPLLALSMWDARQHLSSPAMPIRYWNGNCKRLDVNI